MRDGDSKPGEECALTMAGAGVKNEPLLWLAGVLCMILPFFADFVGGEGERRKV